MMHGLVYAQESSLFAASAFSRSRLSPNALRPNVGSRDNRNGLVHKISQRPQFAQTSTKRSMSPTNLLAKNDRNDVDAT